MNTNYGYIYIYKHTYEKVSRLSLTTANIDLSGQHALHIFTIIVTEALEE